MHAHNTHRQDLTSPENKVSYNRRTHEFRKIVIRITRIIILQAKSAEKLTYGLCVIDTNNTN